MSNIYSTDESLPAGRQGLRRNEDATRVNSWYHKNDILRYGENLGYANAVSFNELQP